MSRLPSPQVHEKDSTSADVYSRMETLERGIAEREASLAQKDSLLQEARDERDRLREEHGQATADLTRELDEKTDKVKSLDQQVRTDSLFDNFLN